MATVKQFELIRLDRGVEGERFTLGDGEFIIGRSDEAAICLEGKTISRKHMRLWAEGDAVAAEDLGSRNGFKINGVRVRSGRLYLGDKLEIGEFLLLLSDTENGHKTAKVKSKPETPDDAPAKERFVPVQSSNDDARMRSALAIAGKLIPHIANQEDLLQRMAKAALQSAPANRCFILGKAPGARALTVLGTYNAKGASNGPSLNQTAIDYVFRDGEAFIQGDIEETADTFSRTGPTGALCVPLEGRSRRVGVLYLDTGFNPSRFTQANLEDIKALGRALGLALELSMDISETTTDAKMSGQTEAAAGFARALASLPPDAEAIANASRSATAFTKTASLAVTMIDAVPVVQQTLNAITSAEPIAFEKPERVLVAADPHALSALLRIALERAVAAGGKIQVSAANEDNQCVITVSDSGTPIRTEQAVRFGADLSAVDPERGAGLDIAALYRLTEAQRGRVECSKGADGQGTRVRITLPTRPAAG